MAEQACFVSRLIVWLMNSGAEEKWERKRETNNAAPQILLIIWHHFTKQSGKNVRRWIAAYHGEVILLSYHGKIEIYNVLSIWDALLLSWQTDFFHVFANEKIQIVYKYEMHEMYYIPGVRLICSKLEHVNMFPNHINSVKRFIWQDCNYDSESSESLLHCDSKQNT